MGNMAKPNLVISVDDAGVISMKSESTFKTTEIKFKLDEEFDEITADGRKTKVRPLICLQKQTCFFCCVSDNPIWTSHPPTDRHQS